MILDPETGSKPEPTSVLQAQFHLSELDRTISSRRFQLASVQWLYIPVLLVALIAMIVGLVLGWGSFGPVLGGAVAIFGGVLSLFQKAGGLQDDLADLQEERDSTAAVLEAGVGDDPGRLAG
jgi:hypothetical protein